MLILQRFLVMAASVVVAGIGAAWAVQAQPPEEHVYLGGTTRGEEENVRRWLSETYAILRSDAFHENLKALDDTYPNIWLSKWERYRTPAELSNILKLEDPDKPDAWWVPTALALVGSPNRDSTWDSGYSNEGNHEARVGWTGYQDGSSPAVAMQIGRVHYDRYINGNQVERSCAINTLAHEISHTLSHRGGQYVEYFLDTDDGRPDNAGEPFASYLIGALAQCTYLQNHGRITTTEELKTCVGIFGVDEFKRNLCNDYSDDAPIELPQPVIQPQPQREL